MAYIPYAHKTYINKLRKFLGDEATLNKLLEAEEADDAFLYEALTDALDVINYEYAPLTTYTLDDFPAWPLLKAGATLQVLIGKGILSARNTLTYNDASNITVQDTDHYGRYINFFNLITNKFVMGVKMFKMQANIDACYGGTESAFSYDA
jgi:hypothetical protein